MKKILIVDNEPFIRETLTTIFDELSNCKISIAVDKVDEALLIINDKVNNDIKIAIIDVRLRDEMKGLELTKIIKKINKEIKIIQISSLQYKKESLNAGADMFMQKPIGTDVFYDLIKNLNS